MNSVNRKEKQSSNSLVSIIMPIYNAEEFLRQNIESILQQDYKDLELILVDDGSKDGSAAIMQEYEEKDSRVTALHQENSGAPIARNYGLSAAKGKYVQFVDSDDYMAAGALSLLIETAEKENADILIGAYDTVDENGTFIKKVPLPITAGAYQGEKLRERFSLIPPMPGNKLFRAELLRNHQVQFAPSLKQAQDLNFYLKVLLFAEKIAVLDQTVYHYRVRSGSISHTYSLVILETIRSIEDAENYYAAQGVVDETFFANLKFFHYSFQLQKVPQIASKEDRRTAVQAFQKEFGALKRGQLLPVFQGKKLWINRLKLWAAPLFISDWYGSYQRKKAMKNKVS